MEQLSPEQLSPEWFDIRRGVPTGSNFAKIFTGTGKRSDQRWKYMYRLAAEIIFQEVEETFESDDMKWGKKYEPEARAIYEMENEVDVEVPGFQFHPSGLYGCSADGIVGAPGCLEIKCPKRETHIETLHKDKMPTKHIPQVQGHMLVWGKEWCDFVSYYPGAKWFQVRVYPDVEYQEKMHNEIVKFCADLKALVEKLQ